jgi:hypothetical protein
MHSNVLGFVYLVLLQITKIVLFCQNGPNNFLGKIKVVVNCVGKAKLGQLRGFSFCILFIFSYIYYYI